jgi:hypothetical protein
MVDLAFRPGHLTSAGGAATETVIPVADAAIGDHLRIETGVTL